ncbi:MAG: 2-hydroxychromene-2-carboxylate isomerase [Casimicrobiaceae bacterium]
MRKTVAYYFTPGSPWAYLGHERLRVICAQHDAGIEVKPMDLGQIFPVSGGLPLPKRAPQRQAYRLVELRRWREHLGMPLTLQPRFASAPADLGCRWILAAAEEGSEPAMELAGAIMRARWAEERDTGDPAVLADLARGAGLEPVALAARAEDPATSERFGAITKEAIDKQVFGAPTYVYRDELFWGQDRLDFLDRALAQ